MDSKNKRAPEERGAGDAVVCSITAATLHDALSRACAEVGIVDRDVPADGRWNKTDINGDPRGRGDGRIKLFADGEGGIVCNWKGETIPFFVNDGRKLTGTHAHGGFRRQEVGNARAQAPVKRGPARRLLTKGRANHYDQRWILASFLTD